MNKNTPLYKVGVIVPVITHGQKVSILRERIDKLKEVLVQMIDEIIG